MKRVTWSLGIGLDKDGLPTVPEGGKRSLDELDKYVATVYGGYSRYLIRGGWISPTNGLQREPAIVYEVYTELPSDVHHTTARYLGELLNQETVLLTVQPVESLSFVEVKGEETAKAVS